MNTTGWLKGLRVTADGTGTVLHARPRIPGTFFRPPPAGGCTLAPHLDPGNISNINSPRDRLMSPQPQKPSALLSLRTMVIIAISLLVAIGAGGLTYWYISPYHTAAAILAAAASFAASVKFLNDIIATD